MVVRVLIYLLKDIIFTNRLPICFLMCILLGCVYLLWCLHCSEEEAKKKMYNACFLRGNYGFGCEIDEKTSEKLKGDIFLTANASFWELINICSDCFGVLLLCRPTWCPVCSSGFLCWCRKQRLRRYISLFVQKSKWSISMLSFEYNSFFMCCLLTLVSLLLYILIWSENFDV